MANKKIYVKNPVIKPSEKYGALELYSDYIVTDNNAVVDKIEIQGETGRYMTLIKFSDKKNLETVLDVTEVESSLIKELVDLESRHGNGAFLLPKSVVQKRKALMETLGLQDIADWNTHIANKINKYNIA